MSQQVTYDKCGKIGLVIRVTTRLQTGILVRKSNTVCQDISDTLDEAARLDAIIIDFSKAFDLVPHDRLLKKTAASGVDSRVVIWIREFLIGRSQRVRVERHYLEEVRVTSGVPQGSVLGPLVPSLRE